MPDISQASKLLIIITIIGIVELILILIFWFKHLRYHIKHIIYRIRHPIFWIISLCTACLFISIRPLTIYGLIHNYVSNNLFIELQVFMLLLMGFSFPFGRIFFLFYALKLQKYEQNSLIKKFMNQHNSTNNNNNASTNGKQIPFIYAHSDFFQPTKIFIIFEFILLFIWIIHCTLSVTNVDTAWTVLIIKVVCFLLILSFLFMISSLWCCTKTHIHMSNKNEEINGGKTFRDDFKFRLEMTLMLLVIIFGFTSTILLGNNLEYPESEHYIRARIISAIVTCIVQTSSIIIQILIPYSTLEKHISNFNDKNNDKYHVVSLFDILRHQYGFFLFIDQLCQEISFENIGFLIEIHQFKYITNKDIIEYQNRKQFKQYFKRNKLRKHISNTVSNGNNVEAVNRCTITDEPKAVTLQVVQSNSIHKGIKTNNTIEDCKYDHNNTPKLELNMWTRSNTFEASTSYTADSLFDEYSHKKGDADNEYYSHVLSKMPWGGVPLSDSVYNNITNELYNKLIQAQNIYNKYMDRNAYDRVNCSSNTFYIIEMEFNKLKAWIDKNGNNNGNNNNGEVNENGIDDIELGDIGGDIIIKTEEQWNEMLLKVFDASLAEIFDNLEDSMTRFRHTKEFLLLTQSK